MVAQILKKGKPLSIGKLRGLQACATPHGTFSILAADHRDALRRLIFPITPEKVASERLTELKLTIVEVLAPAASAVLLDPIYSVAQSIADGKMPGYIGLLCAMEEQGYLGSPQERRTCLIAGWTVEKAKRLGANGIKLLLFYHPEAGEATQEQENLVRALVSDCQQYDMPFFLEPISFSLDPGIQKGSREFAAQRRRIVVASARRLSALGPEVIKVEFPIDVQHETDLSVWADACAELNQASQVPWVLLSGGEPFEVFKQQLKVACQNGCSGFVVGRAVWQEAAQLEGYECERFLAGTARARLMELDEIAQEYATPWTDRYACTTPDEHWYEVY